MKVGQTLTPGGTPPRGVLDVLRLLEGPPPRGVKALATMLCIRLVKRPPSDIMGVLGLALRLRACELARSAWKAASK